MPEQTVQQKLDQLVKYASDIHEDTSTTLIEDNKKTLKQNKVLFVIVAIQSTVLVAAMVVLAVLLTNSFDNKDTLGRLDRNQKGIDELVTFVHSVQDQQSQQGSGTSQAVTDIKVLICAAVPESLELRAACNQQGITVPPG